MPHTSPAIQPAIPAMPIPVGDPLSINELTSVLIKHYGLNEGHYDLLIEFQIAMGSVGPDPASLSPGAMIGISKLGLVKSPVVGPSSVDAAVVNPAKQTRKKREG